MIQNFIEQDKLHRTVHVRVTVTHICRVHTILARSKCFPFNVRQTERAILLATNGCRTTPMAAALLYDQHYDQQ